ncbi:transposable element Tcb1 transposase [Trichonephila clavipes]|nr:transposable element Tcb1 transposase [Trichonephila clavipes]
MGAEFLFMDDNAHPNRANIIDECVQSEDITRMDWSAYSPDLNPIEHVWDMIGRQIAPRQPHPTCLPELREHCLMSGGFNNGATCCTARATIDLLKDTFGDRLISRFGPVNWPSRSCDLTSLDYFLWGYVKSLVYAIKPQTLDHLEDNIRRVIADIRPQMLEKSSKIARPDWTASEPAVAVLCQKSYLKCNATRLSFE